MNRNVLFIFLEEHLFGSASENPHLYSWLHFFMAKSAHKDSQASKCKLLIYTHRIYSCLLKQEMVGSYNIQVHAKHSHDTNYNILSLPLKQQWIYFICKPIFLESLAHLVKKSLCNYCKAMASTKICHLKTPFLSQ